MLLWGRSPVFAVKETEKLRDGRKSAKKAYEKGQTMNGIRIGRYRHFKGNEYEVLFLANHSETGEEMVIYRACYGEKQIWVRPASMWNETVERDGKIYRRFTYIGD